MNPDDPLHFVKDGEEDSLETLEENLYSRRGDFSATKKSEARFKKHDVDVARGWGREGAAKRRPSFSEDETTQMSFLKKLFIASVVFFLISASVAGYTFWGGGNVISSKNVDIGIIGPVSVAGGEILSLEIRVSNQNNADLETADLIIDYPEGTRQAEDMTVSLRRYREALGAIVKGGSATKKIQAVLFGQEGDVKDMRVSVEYRVKGSNAIFPKEKKYSVAISSAPVTMTIASVKEINANQETELTVDVVSNATSVIQKLALSVEYPFGFLFKSSTPSPSWSNSFWQFGDLKPGAKRTVKVRGTIAGQDNEDRTFRFSVGTESPTNENSIGTNFLTTTQKIAIRKPFIGAALAFNGDTSDVYIAKPGKNIRADLVLQNNIGVKITDIKVSIKITGAIFDPASVELSNGFYRSYDRTILWDQTLKPDLAVFNPDDAITLSFSLGTLSEEVIRSIKGPSMNLAVTVTGKRQNEAGLSQEVSSTVSKDVRVPSSLAISARSLYFSGAFTNTGPIPPKVDADTSYTIVWSLTNGSGDLSNVKAAATLPSYVKWLAVVEPKTEKISYNPVGGQVVWEVGDLKAGTGFSGSPREVSFQVSLMPSVSQVRTSPTLVTEVTASGDDSFVNQAVTASSRNPLTTELPTDISFKPGQGTVIK